MSVLFILLPFFVFCDLFFLKKIQKETFRQVISYTYSLRGIVAILCVVLVAQVDSLGDLAIFLLALLVVFYLLRRARAVRRLQSQGFYDECHQAYPFVLSMEATGILLKWFIAVIAASFILKFSSQWVTPFEPEIVRVVLLSFLAGLIMLGLIEHMSRRLPGATLKELLGLKAPVRSFFKLWFVPICIGVSFAAVSSWVLFFRDVTPVTPFSELMDQAETPLSAILFLVIGLVTAPLLEELIFRGYFFYVLQRVKGRGVAVLVVTLIFGGIHIEQYSGDYFSILAVMGIGLMLTLMRAWTGSAKPSVVMHYVFNISMVIIPVAVLSYVNPSYLRYRALEQQLSPLEKNVLLMESLREYPQNTEALYDLARLSLEDEGDFQRALEFIDRALKYNPGRSIFLELKADILFEMGDRAAALEVLTDLDTRYPGDPAIEERIQELSDP
ncbi:MAG TPA: CPBP family glutamic-type intramembrane protease [Candidatus Omnitrophota bacterium]|nr:CPBP family glutamic-type intramembrane protease [Candidatus Omnitrophota bacterium]